MLAQEHCHDASGLVELFGVVGVRFIRKDELGNGDGRRDIVCLSRGWFLDGFRRSGDGDLHRQLAVGDSVIGVLGGLLDRVGRVVGLELGKGPFAAQELQSLALDGKLGS